LAAGRAKRIAEAEEFKGKAENYLKTSFLQWKPDYIASAPMFERAAELYKQADDLESAANMMLKAAQSHEGYNALASVAVANTKAAGFMKSMGSGREKRVAELLSTAAEFWGLSGDLQKYGETLAKAAKEVRSSYSHGFSVPACSYIATFCSLPCSAGGREHQRGARAVQERCAPFPLQHSALPCTVCQGPAFPTCQWSLLFYGFPILSILSSACAALSILCPDGRPNSPLVTEILRGVFSFLVRKRLLADALLLAKDMVRVFQEAGLESSAHKVLASVTIIQLAQGDAVQVRSCSLCSSDIALNASPPLFHRRSRHTCRST
jgi:hypothetical protein